MDAAIWHSRILCIDAISDIRRLAATASCQWQLRYVPSAAGVAPVVDAAPGAETGVTEVRQKG
jgi:hypothetical protein